MRAGANAAGGEADGPDATSDAPQSALYALLPHILDTFRREPALALTAAYLVVALAGIFYDYSFFEGGFGIPVLTLSQVGDFLVAGLQNPIAIALMLSTFPVCWLYDRINLRSRRRRQRTIEALRARPRRSRWSSFRLRFLTWHQSAHWPMQLTYLVVVVLYGWMFVGVYAHHRVDAVRHGDVPRVAVRLAGQTADLAATDPAGWGYLGAVSNYVFIYDPKAGRAMALPVNAIEQIRPEAVKANPGLPLPVVKLQVSR